MIAVDANVLVYAHRAEMKQHAAAVRKLKELIDAAEPIALTWTAIYQFLRVVTHPGIHKPPSSLDIAWRYCGDLFAFPNVVILSETENHAQTLDRLVAQVGSVGNHVHDAHIVAVMIEHGVRDILSNDADFERYPGIRLVGLE